MVDEAKAGDLDVIAAEKVDPVAGIIALLGFLLTIMLLLVNGMPLEKALIIFLPVFVFGVFLLYILARHFKWWE